MLTNVIFQSGLVAPASPGSIFAVLINTAPGSYLGVVLSVVLSAGVTFLVTALLLLASRKRDLQAEAEGGDSLAAAIAQTELNKGKSSSALSGLAAGAGAATAPTAGAQASTAAAADQVGGVSTASKPIRNIVFACDAGMGSSAMGASVLRNKIKKAGIDDVTVVNKAIANLDPSASDLVITQNQLTDRAKAQTPDAVHVSVDNFMNSPRYDEVVQMVREQHEAK